MTAKTKSTEWTVVNLDSKKYPNMVGVYHVRDKKEALELAELITYLGCEAYWYSPGHYPEDLFDN